MNEFHLLNDRLIEYSAIIIRCLTSPNCSLSPLPSQEAKQALEKTLVFLSLFDNKWRGNFFFYWGLSPPITKSYLFSRHNLPAVRRQLCMPSYARSEGPVSKSSYFLGDPPPDPRFLASLGALSLVDLNHCSVT
jgi:hypothetical protein